jgi:hypothetical protein
MNQDNLHPMNRSDFPQPDWNNPNWVPDSYPSLDQLPKMPEGLSHSDYLKKAESVRDEAAALWPALSDYLKHQYDQSICKSRLLPYFEPRRIVPPGGYPSPKCVAASLFCTMAEIMMKYESGMTVAPTEITALLLSYAVLDARVPVFYVSDAFIRAVAATELPGDFTLQDLHWPMPAMALAFPTRFLHEITGRDIGYVFAADLDEGDHPPPSFLKGQGLPTVACPSKIAFQFHTYNRGLMESYVTSWLKRDRVNETASKYRYTDYTEALPEKVDSDRITTEKIGALLLKLLVVLNTRPGYVEPHKLQRKAKFSKKNVPYQTELWSPNIIGFNYKPQRQEAPAGTHASPRFHWRRGHITHQRVGSFKSPDFVSIASLPVIEDGVNKGQVDWLKVSDETRAAFWRCHARRWLEPTLINFEEPECE